MAQFDVYRAAGSLLLDVQTDLLEDFQSRVMVPLLPPGTAPIPHPRLNPAFVVDGQRYHMVTQFIGAIRSRDLGQRSTISIAITTRSERPST